MTFVRTVLADIDPGELGVTYTHEHLVIDGGRPVLMHPDFDLSDVAKMATEVAGAAALGLRAVVDAMPCDAGRNAEKLAEISRLTGVHVIAPTGQHHERYYGPAHWSHRITVDELADLFSADIEVGIDVNDYAGPVVHRTPFRAGVIKAAGSEGGPSPRDERVFAAAAMAHARTGAPVLTHAEHGTGALEQVRFLTDRGVDPGHIAVSHVDKVVDRGYHRELLATGAFAEYDGAFRWGDRPNGTVQLLEWMVEDGLIGQVVLGMDAARQGYYTVYGGQPGLTFLLDGFSVLMEERGLDATTRHRLFVENPARLFAFGS
ncbi:MAG: phosphotriesterase family protein [Candidatus Limnocylindrales bacterium]